MACKYYITASLLNSWHYNIKNGTLEDFLKVLNKEKFEPTESILKGFAYEKYMQENYEETLHGAYQVKLSKECGNYLLYGILDCLKGGVIYDYKYTASYEVGKFLENYQTPMYLELVPEAKKMVYLITNKFEEGIASETPLNGDLEVYEYNKVGDIFREEYSRESVLEPISVTIDKFIDWLQEMDLYNVYTSNWQCKF